MSQVVGKGAKQYNNFRITILELNIKRVQSPDSKFQNRGKPLPFVAKSDTSYLGIPK